MTVWDSAYGTPSGPGIYGARDVADGAARYNVQGMSFVGKSIHIRHMPKEIESPAKLTSLVAEAYTEAAASLYGQSTFALPKPPGPPPYGLNTSSNLSPSITLTHNWDNETRPAEVPNPNHPDNSPDIPGLTFGEPVPQVPGVGDQSSIR